MRIIAFGDIHMDLGCFTSIPAIASADLLLITGHIHEAMAEDTIGRTRVINHGMVAAGGWIEVTVEPSGITAELKAMA